MRIRQWAVALPRYQVNAEEVAGWCGASPEFVSGKIGIDRRPLMKEDDTVTGLAAEACRRLFDLEPGLNPGEVELMILVTQNPDHPLPHTSALLQDALGLPPSSACFDMNLGCSGYVYALTAAKGFMKVQGLTNALVVTCDPYSKVMQRSDKNTVTIFGDAATATWLSSEKGAELGLGVFGTDGSGADKLIVPVGGSAKPIGGIWRSEPRHFSFEEARLRMDGRAIFNFMMRQVPPAVQSCLEKNRLAREEIDFFVFHQASKFMIESLGGRMKLPDDKVPIVLDGYGNTVSSTIPIILSELTSETWPAGKKALICGFGVGRSWGANVLYF